MKKLAWKELVDKYLSINMASTLGHIQFPIHILISVPNKMEEENFILLIFFRIAVLGREGSELQMISGHDLQIHRYWKCNVLGKFTYSIYKKITPSSVVLVIISISHILNIGLIFINIYEINTLCKMLLDYLYI